MERWSAVDRIFQDALERPPHERALFLEEVCGGDISLRNEVESLLNAHEQAGSFLGRPHHRSASRQLIGMKLGSYQIETFINAGGMGQVYRARDTRLDRAVAIKLIASDLRGRTDFHRRFQREARAISSLNHPHICSLYDIGDQDGMTYLVMEYIEGESLATEA